MPSIEPTIILPCIVCGADVLLASDAPAEVRANPLCIVDFFTEDPTAEWESD